MSPRFGGGDDSFGEALGFAELAHAATAQEGNDLVGSNLGTEVDGHRSCSDSTRSVWIT